MKTSLLKTSLLFFLFLFSLTSLKLSDLTLLLPCISDSYPGTIITSDTCVSWSNSKSRVISITPIIDSCGAGLSKSLIIKPIITTECFENRNSWITAYNPVTSESLACEIFIAQLHSIEILTNTRVIHANDKITLTLQGYDSSRNVFNNLNGLPFIWINQYDHILSRVSITESGISKLADTSILIVEGIICGVSNITVTLNDINHPKLITSLPMTVVEPISMFPSDLTVFPCAEIQYKLFLGTYETSIVPNDQLRISNNFQPSPKALSKKVSKPIILPSYYEFISSKPDVVSILFNEGLATTLALGRALITVRDSRLPAGTPWIGAQAELLVRQPHSLKVLFHGEVGYGLDDVWAFVNKMEYVIEIQLLDKDNNVMIDADNLLYDFTIDLPYTRLNHSYFRVTATTSGTNATILVKLDAIRSTDKCELTLGLSLTQKVTVVDPIKVVPSTNILLPFANQLPEMNLQAFYGSGSYEWNLMSRTLNSNTIQISTIKPIVGVFDVIVRDARNPDNKQSLVLEIATVNALKYVDGVREFHLGDRIHLVLSVFSNNRPFTHCSNIKPTFEHDSSLSLISTSVCSKSCPTCPSSWNVTLLSNSIGFTKVKALLGENSASTTLSIFNPLTVDHSDILVAAKFSNYLTIAGGPPTWNSKHNLFVKSASAISLYYNSTKSLVMITCHEAHLKTYSVCIQNSPSKENPEPVASCVNIRVHCVAPISVTNDNSSTSIGRSLQLNLAPHELTNFSWSVVDNLPIVSVSDSGLVSGLQLGFAAIKVQAVHPSLNSHDKHGLSIFVSVRVIFEDFKILNDTFTIVQQQTTISSIVGLYGESAVDSCFKYVYVEWSVIEGSVLISNPLTFNASLVNGPSVRIMALMPGSATIQARVAVSFPTPSIHLKKLSLRVLPPLKLLSNATLVIQPLSTSRIRTSYSSDLTFALLSSGSSNTTVDSTGLITTGSAEEVVVVVVSSYGQSLFVTIYVSIPSHFIIMSANATSCIGARTNFKMYVADKLNQVFTESPLISSSLNDSQIVVSIDGNDVEVSSQYEGKVAIGFYYQNVVPAFINFNVINCEFKSIALTMTYFDKDLVIQEFSEVSGLSVNNILLASIDSEIMVIVIHVRLAANIDVNDFISNLQSHTGNSLEFRTIENKGSVVWIPTTGLDVISEEESYLFSFYMLPFIFGGISIFAYYFQDYFLLPTKTSTSIVAHGPGAHMKFSHPNNQEFQT